MSTSQQPPQPGEALQPRAAAAAVALGLVVLAALVSLTTTNPAVHQALLLLLWAPIVEELNFRWGLQEALMRAWPRRHGWVALVCAVLFAVAHAATHDAAWLPLYLVPGLALAALYAVRRSLVLCMTAHAAMNGVYLGWML